jgi:hypothetical protein
MRFLLAKSPAFLALWPGWRVRLPEKLHEVEK